jgi:hypothetical protein
MALHLLNIKHPSRQPTPLKGDSNQSPFLCPKSGQPELMAHPITNKIKNLNRDLNKKNLDKDKEDQQ